MRKPGLYLAAASIVVSALLASMPNSHVKADEDQQGSIVGTWIGRATVNTPPGTPPFVFTVVTAFNPGGTVTQTNGAFNAHSSENPFLPPPFVVDESDQYGVWKRLEDSNQFAVTFKALLFAGANTPTALYGSFFPGQNVGVVSIQAVLTLHLGEDGDTLEGPFSFQITNLGGTVVFGGSGAVSATRVKIEPLATP